MGTVAVARNAATSQQSSVEPAASPRGRFVSLLCALVAAWIAAGSTGLLGHGLRHALTLLFLSAALIVGLPSGNWSWRRALGPGAAAVGALFLLASPLAPVNVMASALVLAVLAWVRPASQRTPFMLASMSVLILGLYRFAVTSVPWLWSIADWLGNIVSRAAGFIARQPLRTGATFAGLDYLVVMGVLYALWSARLPRPKLKRSLRVAAAILGAHLLYLIVLAFTPKLQALLPSTPPQPEFGMKVPWDWRYALRMLIPWNLPALAALLHMAGAAFMFKTLPAAEDTSAAAGPRRLAGGTIPRLAIPGLLVLLAFMVPMLSSLHSRPLSLEGKKIVVHEKGFLNWLKPKHGDYGRLSVGMYGMLTEFVQSYGARCLVSPELSESDLQGADLLVLIFPNKPWAEGQLERIWKFVREGGSLLVLGEHTVREKDGGNRFNDALRPTALRVAFDSAMFEVGGWLESYEAISHPATLGLEDHRNEFGAVIGASVETHWPARPLLIGRHGFSDPGDPSNDESKGGSMMGNHKYDAGEKLGDQLLAAEQRLGRGRVVVFGDTSGFSNSILFGSHDFVARLFAYLCDGRWVSAVRLWGTGLGLALLVFLLLQSTSLQLRSSRREEAYPPMRRDQSLLTPAATGPVLIALTALAFSASLAWTVARSHRAANVLPDGRHSAPNQLAYIDTSHLERNSGESWREDGVGGLQLTLMRNNYLVLGLPEFDAQRLQRAGLFISIAPSRSFTTSEIRAVRDFIAGGGIFICTAGWPEARASRELLADLGFYVGGIGAATSGHPEPKPFGHFKAPYFNGGDYMAYVRFHAAWHVESSDPQARPIAYGPRDPKGPPDQPDPTVILMRRIGRGKAVVVADTGFATNRNLEREGGQPFEGMRENADFWRWLLSYLNDQPTWTPPKPVPAPPASPPSGTNTPPGRSLP